MMLSYVDVAGLVQAKQVSSQWKEWCTQAIDQKCGGTPQPFQTNQELTAAVRKYVNSKDNPEEAEEIAKTYGYPIGRWDVSNMEDFRGIFEDCTTFNEDISAWDTSRARIMEKMFCRASSFNQPVGDWNTSRVHYMGFMFSCLLYTSPSPRD